MRPETLARSLALGPAAAYETCARGERAVPSMLPRRRSRSPHPCAVCREMARGTAVGGATAISRCRVLYLIESVGKWFWVKLTGPRTNALGLFGAYPIPLYPTGSEAYFPTVNSSLRYRDSQRAAELSDEQKERGWDDSVVPLLIYMYQSELGQAGVLKQYITGNTPASPPTFPPLTNQQHKLWLWGVKGGWDVHRHSLTGVCGFGVYNTNV